MKNRLFSLMLVIVFLLSAATSCAKPTALLTADDYLSLGEKYLLELVYEQALVQFLDVIEIEPMNPRGYTGAAEAYVGLGDKDSAVAILKQGALAIPGNAEIQSMLDELQPQEDDTQEHEAEASSAPTPSPISPLTPEQEPTPVQEPPPDSYFDALSDEEKQLLANMETATLAYDYQTVYEMQSSAEFHTLCDNITDLGSFWYYPDEETSILVCYQQYENGRGYSMEIFEGRNGEGRYIGSRYGSYGGDFDNYVFHVASYTDGKANGPFIWYVLNYGVGEAEYHTQYGNLRDGAAYGPVYINYNGDTIEQEYDSEWYNWWPEWPEK